ncbi:MAG: hypothetical protein JNM18_07505 [Planctomycetaceae bacterium]|nr:hypothetical protein [Planctomycetaceae bacterium]
MEALETRQLLAIDLEFLSPGLAENGGSTKLVASLDSPATVTTELTLAFAGVANLNRDYQATSSRIAIAPGQLTGSITLTALDDARTEADDLIEVSVTNITGTTQAWSGQPAYARILDDDTPLAIAGTPSNDTLTVWLGESSFRYQLNANAVNTVSYDQANSFEFNDVTGAGVDTIMLILSSTGSQVALSQGSITVEGATPFDLWSKHIERQFVYGSVVDSVVMYGTSGNDTYWGLPTHSIAVTGSSLNQVTGIRNVTMYGQGGTDIALLYSNGPTSVDAFVGNTDSATLSKQSGTTGDRTLSFRNAVREFRYVHAYADDVRDTARLNDAETGDDTLWAGPSLAYITASRNSTYQNTIYNYRTVRAVSTGGNDRATLTDSAGIDTLVANNMQSRLTYANRGFVEAQGFRDVTARSTWNAAADAVYLTDSWIADIDTTSSHALERARDDYLSIYDDTAQVIYGNRSVLAKGFERLDARATLGGTDTVTQFASRFVSPTIFGFVAESSMAADKVTQLQATRAYLRNVKLFDIRRYVARGTDYLNPEFADMAGRLREEWADAYPGRLPLTASNISQVTTLPIYDFSRLETVERKLTNVLRQSVFQRLFDEITRNAKNNVERQTAVIEFGHKSVRHTEYIQPLTYDLEERARTGRFVYNGMGVLDPLVLLELAEGRCGQVNKLNADLWHALGFRARLLGVNSHTSGEVFYEGQWHYNDSGAFGGDDVPLIPIRAGSSTLKVPSFQELRQRPDLVDLLPFYTGVMGYVGNRFPGASSPRYASPSFFDNMGDVYTYCEKTAIGDAQAQNSRYYGWDNYFLTPIDWITRLPSVTFGTQPSPAYINDVSVTGNGSLGGTATIGWRASYDNYRQRLDSRGNPLFDANGRKILDWRSPTGSHAIYSDVVGYRVFVSTTSRGWNYNEYQGTDSVAPAVKVFKANNALWTPAMYDARYTPAPRDVMTVFAPAKSTTLGGQEQVQLQLPGSGTYYVSIMAVDARGLAIGKTNYMLSEEIKITI